MKVFDPFEWADLENDERKCNHIHKDFPENSICEDCKHGKN